MDNEFIGPHQEQNVVQAGQSLSEAKGAMIIIHGRGDNAANIISLGQAMPHPSLSYLAPQAAQSSWYPYSFLAPISQNQPGIDSGLARIGELLATIEEAGIPATHTIIAGFSQGACLTSEFAARNPQRFGGLLIFSGGVIGPLGMVRQDEGDLVGTPIFIGCSDVDAHIPVERVRETANIMRALGGDVVEKIYPGMAHTIIQDEIDEANKIVQKLLGDSDA